MCDIQHYSTTYSALPLCYHCTSQNCRLEQPSLFGGHWAPPPFGPGFWKVGPVERGSCVCISIFLKPRFPTVRDMMGYLSGALANLQRGFPGSAQAEPEELCSEGYGGHVTCKGFAPERVDSTCWVLRMFARASCLCETLTGKDWRCVCGCSHVFCALHGCDSAALPFAISWKVKWILGSIRTMLGIYMLTVWQVELHTSSSLMSTNPHSSDEKPLAWQRWRASCLSIKNEIVYCCIGFALG